MIVFYYPFQGDPAVWALSFAGTPTWRSFYPSGTTPPGREGHFAFYDPVRDRMVVFGGEDHNQYKNDVWALNLSGSPSWIELTPSGTPPPPRVGPAVIYDPTWKRMILFGGSVSYNDLRNDAWELTVSETPTWRRWRRPVARRRNVPGRRRSTILRANG